MDWPSQPSTKLTQLTDLRRVLQISQGQKCFSAALFSFIRSFSPIKMY